MRILFLLGAMVLTACSGPEETASVKTVQSIDDGRWAVFQLDGADLTAGQQAWLEVSSDQGTIVASAGCNQLMARFEGAPDAMTMGPVGATKKLCPDAMMAQERRLSELLSAATSVKVDDNGVLWLSGSRGMLKARLVAP